MKIVTHTLALALGIALGITWMSRPGQPPEPTLPAEEPAVEKAVDIVPPPAPRDEKPAPNAPPTEAPKATKVGTSELIQAINSQDIASATRMVQELEKNSPNSVEAIEGRGALQMRLNDWRNAKATMKRCLETYPESQTCLRGMVLTELRLGTEEEQEAAINNCLTAVPNDPECKVMQASVKLNRENYDEAISIYEELIRDNGRYGPRIPQEALDWQMALALEEAGRDSEAANYFDKACRSNNQEACRRVEELRGQF